MYSPEVGDPGLVDLVFAGEHLDYLFLLSKKHLYKLTGSGITRPDYTTLE